MGSKVWTYIFHSVSTFDFGACACPHSGSQNNGYIKLMLSRVEGDYNNTKSIPVSLICASVHKTRYQKVVINHRLRPSSRVLHPYGVKQKELCHCIWIHPTLFLWPPATPPPPYTPIPTHPPTLSLLTVSTVWKVRGLPNVFLCEQLDINI